MFLRNNQTTWGYKTMPPSYEECKPNASRRRSGYMIEASSYALLIGAVESRRAKWLHRRSRLRKAAPELPPENVAAIKMLDRWLAMPETDSGERAEGIRRRIDKNRLSDRNFFT
jgi:hypothetical protein